MTEFNRQEIFNKAYEGLRAQGFERSVAKGYCAYRTEDGRKCAIGHLISDENYSPELEGKFADTRDVWLAALPTSTNYSEAIFLREIQVCHDEERSAAGVEHRLLKFAEKNELTVPVSS